MNCHGTYCCVLWCPNSKRNYNRSLSFFRVPVGDRGKAWLLYAERQDLLDLPPRKVHNYRMCGAHFAPDRFTSRAQTRLKSDAIPSVKPEKCIHRTVRSQRLLQTKHAVPDSVCTSIQGAPGLPYSEPRLPVPATATTATNIHEFPQMQIGHVVPASVCISISGAPGLPHHEPGQPLPVAAATATNINEFLQLQPERGVPAAMCTGIEGASGFPHSEPELPELLVAAPTATNVNKLTQLQPRHVVLATVCSKMQEDPGSRHCEPRLLVSAAAATNLNKLPELQPRCVALASACNSAPECRVLRPSEPRLPVAADLNTLPELQPRCVVWTSVCSSTEGGPGFGSTETTQTICTVPIAAGNLLDPRCVVLGPASPGFQKNHTFGHKEQAQSISGITAAAATHSQFLESQAKQVLLAQVSSGPEEYSRLGCSGFTRFAPAVAPMTADSGNCSVPQHTCVALALTSNRIQEHPEPRSRGPTQSISGSERWDDKHRCVVPALMGNGIQEGPELRSRGPTQPIPGIVATVASPSELFVQQHTHVPALTSNRVQEVPEPASREPAQLISGIGATVNHRQVREPQAKQVVLARATSVPQCYSGRKRSGFTQFVPVVATTSANPSELSLLQHTFLVPALTSNEIQKDTEIGSRGPTRLTSDVAVTTTNHSQFLESQAKRVVLASATSGPQEHPGHTGFAHSIRAVAGTATNPSELLALQHTRVGPASLSNRVQEGPESGSRGQAQSISNVATTAGNSREHRRPQHSWVVLTSAGSGIQRDRLRSKKPLQPAATAPHRRRAKMGAGSNHRGEHNYSSSIPDARSDTIRQTYQDEFRELKVVVNTMQQEIASLREENTTLTKRIKKLET